MIKKLYLVQGTLSRQYLIFGPDKVRPSCACTRRDASRLTADRLPGILAFAAEFGVKVKACPVSKNGH